MTWFLQHIIYKTLQMWIARCLIYITLKMCRCRTNLWHSASSLNITMATNNGTKHLSSVKIICGIGNVFQTNDNTYTYTIIVYVENIKVYIGWGTNKVASPKLVTALNAVVWIYQGLYSDTSNCTMLSGHIPLHRSGSHVAATHPWSGAGQVWRGCCSPA